MTVSIPFDPVPAVATALGLPPGRVAAAVKLFAAGNTVPFIARYRKEATEGLDEVALRDIAERHEYLRQLHDRKQSILGTIEKLGLLTDELREKISACVTKTDLEDAYLPYKPKKQTRGSKARERGLGPLAERILAQPEEGKPEEEAAAFVNAEKGVEDVAAALKGARDIVAEHLSELTPVRQAARDEIAQHGVIVSEAVPEKTKKPTKFEQYYAHREGLKKIPSHRYLALQRGEKAGILRVKIEVDQARLGAKLGKLIGIQPARPFATELTVALADSLIRLILPSVSSEARKQVKEEADRAALAVFASNLRNVLLAAPMGAKQVVGIDPGIRTGCKCVAVDSSGKFLEELTIYPWKGDGAVDPAAASLREFLDKHKPFAIAVGNGTGGRETEQLARKVGQEAGLGTIIVSVNESGASIYSASDLAREELPDLDVTVRGSVSIARRLQDPLAELVKLDPKSIGVGQYQHDVNQPLLKRQLSEVVESCVNHVGVDLNTASPALLAYVAGIGPSVAKKLVEHRNQHGTFKARTQLLEVAGLGQRAFEQAAGFLRINGGEHCLDSSAVHPERYPLVEQIATDLGVAVESLAGNTELADRIEKTRYVSDDVGLPTLDDIVDELKKPGRDPRSAFEPPKFRDDVNTLADLKVGMKLEGVVTNVTAFGAFVDIGVHQDGLVHISRLGGRFVKDPSELVQVGHRLEVNVLAVDVERKRISLTTADGERKAAQSPADGKRRPAGKGRRPAKGKGSSTKPAAAPASGGSGPTGPGAGGRPPRAGGRPGRDKRSSQPRSARGEGGGKGGKPMGKPGGSGKGQSKPGDSRRDGGKPQPEKPAELFNNPFAVLKKS